MLFLWADKGKNDFYYYYYYYYKVLALSMKQDSVILKSELELVISVLQTLGKLLKKKYNQYTKKKRENYNMLN